MIYVHVVLKDRSNGQSSAFLRSFERFSIPGW